MSLREETDGRPARLAARVRSAVLIGKTDGRPAPLVEVAGLPAVILIFSLPHGAAGQDAAAATADALALQSIERALHLDITLAANRWPVEHPAFIQPAVLYYRLYHFVILGVPVWLFIRHAEVYVTLRRTLVAMALLVLPVFWALPMSPPRFALPGVVDIVAEYDIFGGIAARGIESGHNVYSAMPSMHMAWSPWCAYAVWYALRTAHPRAALSARLFPLGMAAVVLTTGNHYVLDIAGGIALLLVSIAAASAWNRLAAHRWIRR